ncbi:MAG: DUF3021 family protein [Clostridiales bacterium]|nr:DUF3021 family protein [Clostridiales bacterium]
MKKNTILTPILYMMVGIAFGAIIITVSLYASGDMNDTLKEIIIWLIASAVIGLISTIYESDRFTDITATLVHAPVTFIVALISGWMLDYGDGSVLLLIQRMLPVIVIIYVVIHLVLFLFRRAALREVNRHLKK